ncbi:MAG: hypothetical protein HDR00_12285 [Lachnospiraceae bacterium]|nr:hypothetical protein [Lachnospiraceae bacterium]MBD5541941.1 hypothetical protein [Lachnospiraceae bacterium]
MRHLWEVLLAAEEEGIPEEKLRFVHTPSGSGYMELSLPCLNQTWLDEEEQAEGGQTEDINIGVNTYYRFYDIFYNMFPPDAAEFPALRESLTNLSLHMLAQNDIRRGLTKEDYHKRLLAKEILAGGFGGMTKDVFLSMNRTEREKLLGGWLNSFRVGSALPVFLDMVHGLVADSIVYHSNECPDEVLVYTGLRKERNLEQRIQFLIDTFLDIRYHVEIFYEFHFGIIGVEETMQIDAIAIC